MKVALSPHLLEQLSEYIASRMGLHFPQERWGDLANGLASAAREQGLSDAEAYVHRLLSSPLTRAEIEKLACHLTVGETYFFREKRTFDILEKHVLPELIRLHRGVDMRLRIWSAACCTGEEPYSIAMLLDGLIPDLSDWNITILASDINPRFLEIASGGVYGEWSFRAIPPGIRERYFSLLPDGRMQIAQRIRRLVTFSFLNLAEDSYPSLVSNTNAMDVVLCRNVLMYFQSTQAARVVGSLHRALVENGWLLVAPSETSQILYRQFTVVAFPDATLYRKSPGLTPVPVAVESASARYTELGALDGKLPLVEEDRHETDASSAKSTEVDFPISAARALANEGKLAEAFSLCDRAVSFDALNPVYRFLRAMVMQELGRLDEAMRSLEQALYLDQDFIMAHFALGNLAKRLGRRALAQRHFRNALTLLEGLEPDAPLPESDGLTAGRLKEIVHSTWDGEAEKP